MRIISYIKEKLKDPVNLGAFLILLMPLIFALGYALSFYAGSDLIFYAGIYVCGILTFIPLWMLIGFFLLLINPAKYKEYEMKQIRKKKEREKELYLLIIFCFSWIHPKETGEK